MSDPDPLFEEMVRARRDRRPLVIIAAAIGITLGVTLGMAMLVGTLDGDRSRNHAALVFFLTPLLVSMAIGYAVYRWRIRRR